MKLKEISYDSEFHQGFGAGVGEVITIVYECPCGKGTVVYEKDDIPAFKDSTTRCLCNDCKDSYIFGRRGLVTKK